MPAHRVISADSHVIEPPNLWLDHIEPAFRQRAPRCERIGGKDVFQCDGVDLIQPGPAAGAGQRVVKREVAFEEIPRACWDPDARVPEILKDGVEAEVMYPSVAMRMFAIPDPAYLAACFRAYNDWMAGFVRRQPRHFAGLGLIPIDDIQGATLELRRCAGLGLSGACITVSPAHGRQYDDTAYDPLWAAAAELGMPLSLHVLTGQGSEKPVQQRSPVDLYLGGLAPPSIIQAVLLRMIVSGVFKRHPGLQVVSAENDSGWAGYFIERLDYIVQRRQYMTGKGALGDDLPSTFFRSNVSLTFQRDRAGILVRSMIGTDRLLWGSDYPHTDSTWPNSMDMLDRLTGDIPQAERAMIAGGNAARLYRMGAA